MIFLIIYGSGFIFAWGLLGGAIYSDERYYWPDSAIESPSEKIMSFFDEDMLSENLFALFFLLGVSWLSFFLILYLRCSEGDFGKTLFKFWWKGRPGKWVDQVIED